MATSGGKTIAKGGVILLFVAALIVAGKAASVTMPYRVLETDYFRWTRLWSGGLTVAAGCVALWIRLSSTYIEKTGGWIAGFALLVLFLFSGPNGPHSIIRVKNICISQLREIDGAKEQWAMENAKEEGEEVDRGAVIELLKAKKLPECPKGGPYRIGKVGEVPRCRIAEHNLE